ncbi:MAG: hypothetical protein HQ541_01900 [Mariniphaga sp.]|nr:hypothetical protein [Mariniphaga sp.]
MKKYILIIICFVLAFTSVFAQEEKDKTPVSEPFASGYLIDHQTSYIPDVKTLEFVIQHKFGNMTNGVSDLWGIYSPGANVRMGLNYVIRKNFQVGIGQTKKNMYTDFNAKWTIFEQTKSNSMPVAVTLFGSMAIDGRDDAAFGTSGAEINDRFSYFSQIIVGRKFTDWLSLQAAASFTHYNLVGPQSDHDKVGIHFDGRVKFSPQSSLIFNYDIPLKIKEISEQIEWIDHPKPNLSVGIEIATYTHAFQIYVGTADGIIPQDVIMNNQNDWTDKGLAIGFTITRLWMF